MKFIKQSIRPAIMLLIISLIVIGCAGILDSYTPATFTIDGDRSVMSGVIDGSTPERVQALINEHPNVKTIIMQQVDGSTDDEANVVAARLVRKHGFNTHVPANGEIASGGVDFFLAGVERTVETGARLGVHSWAAGDGETGATVPKDDPQHKLYLDYYAEMGIPADFYWFTLQAAPAEDIHWMTVAELEEYQMITSPPLVRAAPKSAAQTDKFYATGNPESDVVLVNAQGGPVPFLFTDDFAEMFGAVSQKVSIW